MSKYRIVRNTQDDKTWYTVEKQWLWVFWCTLTYEQGLPFGCIAGCPDDYEIRVHDHKFDTWEQAKRFILELKFPTPLKTVEIVEVIE